MAGMLRLLLSLTLVVICTAGGLAAPSEDTTDTKGGPISEAVPRSDFTVNDNISASVEQVFADAHLSLLPGSFVNPDNRFKRRPCACSTSIGVYGGRQETAFVDVPTNPCNVHITDIWISHGDLVDSIQVRYNDSESQPQTMPRRGGPGGAPTHIAIPQGGKVMGLSGGIRQLNYKYHVSQLRILVLDADEHLLIYGPFGTLLHTTNPSSFAVYGDIKSIFGYYGLYLNGLGVFYEPWGVCGSPCAVDEAGSGTKYT